MGEGQKTRGGGEQLDFWVFSCGENHSPQSSAGLVAKWAKPLTASQVGVPELVQFPDGGVGWVWTGEWGNR